MTSYTFKFDDPITHTFDCGTAKQAVIGDKKNVDLLRTAWEKLENDKAKAIQEKEASFAKLTSENQKKVQELEQTHKKNLKELEDRKDLEIKERDDQIQKLKAEHGKEMAKLKNDHQKALKLQADLFDDKYDALARASQQTIQNKEFEIKKLNEIMKTTSDKLREDLEKANKKNMEDMEKTNKENMENIKRQLARDSNSNMSAVKLEMAAMMLQIKELMLKGNSNKWERTETAASTDFDGESESQY